MNIGALVIINFDDFIPPSSRKKQERTYLNSCMLHGIHIIYKEGAGGMDGWPKTIAILEMDIGRLQNWTGALLGRVQKREGHIFFFFFSLLYDTSRWIPKTDGKQQILLLPSSRLQFFPPSPTLEHGRSDRGRLFLSTSSYCFSFSHCERVAQIVKQNQIKRRR